jgi:hypothetical protein
MDLTVRCKLLSFPDAYSG